MTNPSSSASVMARLRHMRLARAANLLLLLTFESAKRFSAQIGEATA